VLPDLEPIAATPPPPLQRAFGAGRLTAASDGGRTRLGRLRQEGCAKIRLPRDAAAAGLEAVLLNTAGGLTGGDVLDWRIEAEAGADVIVATQACEKVYRARDGAARTAVALRVGEGARLAWLPQEAILFDGAALTRRLDADLAAGARLIAVEAAVLGRTAMGETVRQGVFRDRWRIRREGRLAFADDMALVGPVSQLADLAPLLGGGRAFATVLLVAADAERFVEPLRRIVGPTGGVSAFDGKLVARLVAADGLSLRRVLLPALEALRDGAPLPRVWRI
jgi:urease accessory protein